MSIAKSLTLNLTQTGVAAAVAEAATHDWRQALAVALALPLFQTIARRAHSRAWALARPAQPKAARRVPTPAFSLQGVSHVR